MKPFTLGEDVFKVEFKYQAQGQATRHGFVTCLLYKNGELWSRANASWRDSKRVARKLALAKCIGSTGKAEGRFEIMIRPQRKLFWTEVARRMRMVEDKAVAGHVPGNWVCESCGFVLHKRFLAAQTGQVGTDDRSKIELCPNDNTLMRRQTWREYADGCDVAIRGLHRLLDLQEAQITALRAELAKLKNSPVD
jgi:hypothetical protein